VFRLGRDPDSKLDVALPPHHFVTHAAAFGMTGSGKTGLCIALVEEALRCRVPVLMIDVKGDLANLALVFDDAAPASFLPWIDEGAARREGKDPAVVAEETATRWREGLAGWGIGAEDLRALRESIELRIITPGTLAGEPLHVLSPLEQRSDLWELDEEAAREGLSAALSLLLRMVERDPDPTKGREHVLLAHLCERRLRAGTSAGLEAILADLQAPPIERVGALAVDEFLPPKERAALAKDLNALIASPTFSTWRQGAPLDVSAWMKGSDPKKVPAVIVSVAHLDDDERALVLSLVLEQTLAYVRSLSGTTDLRSLVLFDEVFGFLPPHPANPPTKRPMLALLKQARAFGVGLVVATQNPIDVDYKALSNAGIWFVGRLQTDGDRERVVEGLVGSDGGAGVDGAAELGAIIKALPPRTFFVRDVHRKPATGLMSTRWTMSYLRGPMTRQELKRVAPKRAASTSVPTPSANAPPPNAPVVAEAAPVAVAVGAPALPEGWSAMFPHPPQAPPGSFTYVPHAALLGVVQLADAKLGYVEQRRLALMVPIEGGELQVTRATDFDPGAFAHPAAPGARFGSLEGFFGGARAIKSREKQLRDLAQSSTRATVLENPVVGLLSTPGETPEAFAQRVDAAARSRAGALRAELVAKHDPKLQKLALQRDALRAEHAQAQAALPGGLVTMGAALLGGRGAVTRAMAKSDKAEARLQKLATKLASAEAALAEAVGKRNHEIATKEAELSAAAAATTERVVLPKKDALVVERYAIVWLAR
jgi:DNA helicase HerA-like ATPase